IVDDRGALQRVRDRGEVALGEGGKDRGRARLRQETEIAGRQPVPQLLGQPLGSALLGPDEFAGPAPLVPNVDPPALALDLLADRDAHGYLPPRDARAGIARNRVIVDVSCIGIGSSFDRGSVDTWTL